MGASWPPFWALLGAQVGPSWPPRALLKHFFFKNVIFHEILGKPMFFSRFLPPKTAPKTAQDRPKTPPRRSWSATFPALKNVTDFGPFSARFGVPLGVPVGLPWGPLGVPFGVPKRTYLEDTPKSPPRRPQDAPRGSQEPPGRPPGGSQNAPKTLQEACQSPIKPYKAL